MTDDDQDHQGPTSGPSTHGAEDDDDALLSKSPLIRALFGAVDRVGFDVVTEALERLGNDGRPQVLALTGAGHVDEPGARVPAQGQVRFPGQDGAPDYLVTVEMWGSVPTVVESTLSTQPGGREVRVGDHDALHSGDYGFAARFDEAVEVLGMDRKAVRAARQGSRDAAATFELQRIADFYNQHGFERTLEELDLTRATLKRRVIAGKRAGMIPNDNEQRERSS